MQSVELNPNAIKNDEERRIVTQIIHLAKTFGIDAVLKHRIVWRHFKMRNLKPTKRKVFPPIAFRGELRRKGESFNFELSIFRDNECLGVVHLEAPMPKQFFKSETVSTLKASQTQSCLSLFS